MKIGKLLSGLSFLLWSSALVAQAQQFQQVAPSQPPAKGNGQIVNQLPAAEKARRAAQTGKPLVESLKGVVFVSSASEVRAAGIRSGPPIQPGDVVFAGQSDFPAVVQPFIGQ